VFGTLFGGSVSKDCGHAQLGLEGQAEDAKPDRLRFAFYAG
jgi:hypothetical protein